MQNLKIVFVFIAALQLQYILDPPLDHIINVAEFFFFSHFAQHFSVDLASFLILYISFYALNPSKKASIAQKKFFVQC